MNFNEINSKDMLAGSLSGLNTGVRCLELKKLAKNTRKYGYTSFSKALSNNGEIFLFSNQPFLTTQFAIKNPVSANFFKFILNISQSTALKAFIHSSVIVGSLVSLYYIIQKNLQNN